VTLPAWLQVTFVAVLGSCKSAGSAEVVAHGARSQPLGVFAVSWISHVDWPPSVVPAAPVRAG